MGGGPAEPFPRKLPIMLCVLFIYRVNQVFRIADVHMGCLVSVVTLGHRKDARSPYSVVSAVATGLILSLYPLPVHPALQRF